MLPISKARLKIAFSKSYPDLPGVNVFTGPVCKRGPKLVCDGLVTIGILLLHLMSSLLNFQFLPEASFGLRVLPLPASVCLCVRVFVRPCVCQSRACLHDNSPLVQARITKFGTKVQKTLVKVPIVFGDDRPWPSRSNLTWKSNFTSFWACLPHNSSAVQARITKFGPKMHLSTVKTLLILDKICFDLHLHFQSWNRFFYQIYLCSVCIIFSETRRL